MIKTSFSIWKKNIFRRFLTAFIFILMVAPLQAQEDENAVKIDKFVISAYFGPAWRIAKSETSSSAEEQYFKDLKSGSVFGIKTLVPLSDQSSAIGLMLNHFDNGEARLGGDTENHKTFYIGPSYQMYGADEKQRYSLDYSLGVISHNIDINGSDAFSGSTLGYQMGASYKFTISRGVDIGVELQFVGGMLSKWKTPTGSTIDLDEKDNLFRLDLGFGIDISL